MSVIDEPHDAVAASRCLTARSLDTGRGAITAQHPRRCAWCAIELTELTRRIEGWNAWVSPQDRGRSTAYERHEARVFVEWARKHPAEAEALIVAAQGLDPVAESVALPPPSLTPAPFPRVAQVSAGRSDTAPQPIEEPIPLEEEDVSAWT